MKNIKLTASSAKERLAAEQEVGGSTVAVLCEVVACTVTGDKFLSTQASLLSQLQHPNIVSYKESFQDQYGESRQGNVDTHSLQARDCEKCSILCNDVSVVTHGTSVSAHYRQLGGCFKQT